MAAKTIPLSTSLANADDTDKLKSQGVVPLLDALGILGAFGLGAPIAKGREVGKADLGKRFDVTGDADMTITLSDDVVADDKGAVVLLRNSTAGHTVTLTAKAGATLTPTPVALVPTESVLLTVDDAKKWSVLQRGSDVQAAITVALEASGKIKTAIDAAVKTAVDAAVKPAVDAAVKPAVDAAV
ncbi:hypothetical protein, partial [Pandoraea sp. SD6-2]|uniref:hypothetical protein n=1 Tax=Pandoraea sp. SD6-2 TaxID=1286093 RepID=UPI00032E7679